MVGHSISSFQNKTGVRLCFNYSDVRCQKQSENISFTNFSNFNVSKREKEGNKEKENNINNDDDVENDNDNDNDNDNERIVVRIVNCTKIVTKFLLFLYIFNNFNNNINKHT